MGVRIVEILGRATQGVTRPFICRADDQAIYFVKGRGAGQRSLICEWVAGCLAKNMGLSIAPFAIVDVPQGLIELGSRTDLAELGDGLAFGSRKMDVAELSLAHLPMIPETTQRDVLVFDWWVQNADRSLCAAGGNPNLLWDASAKHLVVIDHNLAFDVEFPVDDFCTSHVFQGQIPALRTDHELQQYYAGVFAKIMANWQAICATVPDEWWYIDREQTLPVALSSHTMQQCLMRYHDRAFWNMK